MERSSKITLAVILSVVLALALYAYYVTQKNTQTELNTSEAGVALKTQAGKAAYTDIDGNPVAIDEYLGKILVVNSWASWCPQCAQELPNLAQLGQEFAAQDVKVLAINRAEPKSTAAAYLAQVNATAGLQLVLDPGDRFYASITGFAMPETVFYDPEGNMIYHHRGAMSYQQMKSQVEAAISQSAE